MTEEETSAAGQPEWYRPARGYTNTVTHPPFEAGNEMALRHGAYSPRRVDPLAAELVDQVLEQAMASGSPTAYLTEVSYRPAVWAWARCEAKVQLLTEWLSDRGGDMDGEGEVRSAALLLEKVERRGESLRARLGLDPLSRARLGRDVAAGSVDVARLMAALEASVDEEPAPTAGADQDDDEEGGDR